ncbi:MAG: hypothetical protein KTR31_07840 [Myxococcales bacterium]|nr:hypothetical protein [Myxococcales bacterium]
MRWWVLIVATACTSDPVTDDVTTSDTSTTDTATTPEEPPPDYGVSGPFGVGTERVTVKGAEGDLSVQVWYPTTDETGTEVRYDGVFAGEAFLGASVVCEQTRPLAAFSHGSGGIRYQSAFLTEHLATHGWVVVAPDHPGNTFFDGFPDVAALLTSRPRDIMDTVDWMLGEVERDESSWFGCTDPAEGYAVIGHSFGGYTAMAVGGGAVEDGTGFLDVADARVNAIVPLAPWDVIGRLDDGAADITVPTLILTGELDETTTIDQVRRMWDPLQVTPRWLAVFPEGGHFSFSPVACFTFEGDGCGKGFLDMERANELTAEATTAFLEGTRGVSRAYEAMPFEAPELEWEEGAR